VVIEPRADGYRTRVVSSPAGEAQAGFVLPFADKDLRLLVLKAAASIDRSAARCGGSSRMKGNCWRISAASSSRPCSQVRVGECLGRSRLTSKSKDAGLRIRLRLPGTLANIPWEYLYDARHGFVGLDPQIALVRSLELPAPLRPFPISLPLRILAMISAPSDIAGLQIEQEWAKLNGALAASRHTSCTLPPAKEEPQPPPDRQLAFSKWLKPTPRSLPSAEGPNRRCCRRSPHQ
jgi:hypothetical protein